MSLGRPDLYIDGRRMQTAPGDPAPALAGLQLKWGTDNALDFAPAATLGGQLLVKGAMPDFLDVGADVGLIDPATSRCLFAGKMQPLTAEPAGSVRSAMRVNFTAAAPLGELEKHNMIDMAWTDTNGMVGSAFRLAQLKAAMPRGWTLDGAAGWDWIVHGDQRHQSVLLLDLLSRYVRSSRQRYSDTSTYVPGAGLRRRLTITEERRNNLQISSNSPGSSGSWLAGSPDGASGTALLPTAAVAEAIRWEKTPADLVTGVQVSTWGRWLVNTEPDVDSQEHEWPLDFAVDTSDLINTYGQSTLKIETSLSPQNLGSTVEAIRYITSQWIDTRTGWRATSLQLPDSRRLSSPALLNLLAVDTRSTAAVSVPGAGGLPAVLRAFVLGGLATWDGSKWNTELTLGRTQ